MAIDEHAQKWLEEHACCLDPEDLISEDKKQEAAFLEQFKLA